MLLASNSLYDPNMMRTLVGICTLEKNIIWQRPFDIKSDKCQGLRIQFLIWGRIERHQALRSVQERLQKNQINILQRRRQKWLLNFEVLRKWDPLFLNGLDWAKGVAVVEPEIEVFPREDSGKGERTCVRFIISKEEFIMDRQQRIFLSHKGADKPQVRRFFSTLKAIGFDPWLDEVAMAAGDELERGLLQGFKDSCAAIFFITPNFLDEAYLRSEVNYAMSEKRSKGERFSIITIVLCNENGQKGDVPELLKQYVWKEPVTELDAMCEILRALPISTGEVYWRE